MSIKNLTDTSAILTWWPSSSVLPHLIALGNREHVKLRPGGFSYKLSDLSPNANHLVTVTAVIDQAALAAKSANALAATAAAVAAAAATTNCSASIEFSTPLNAPKNVRVEKDQNEPDNLRLTWDPVAKADDAAASSSSANKTPSTIGGYSVYLDGKRINEVKNPIGMLLHLITI